MQQLKKLIIFFILNHDMNAFVIKYFVFN